MRFLVDESAGRAIVRYLRSLGHDVVSVQECCPGIEDSEVCAWANREERVIITNDKDLGRLIFQERSANRGVILLRLQDERAVNRVRVISDLLAGYEERLPDHFAVVSESGVRIRPLPPDSEGSRAE
jgi:predicted nuclease of predicted toxin-antitoxin system